MIDFKVFKSSLLDKTNGVYHAFFTRKGGVSKGVYASLNCSYVLDDKNVDVQENRRRAAAYLYSTQSDIITAHQIHGSGVVVVNSHYGISHSVKADSLVTKIPNLAIGVLTADCAPVLFADHEAKIIAATHAGWRGIKLGILEKTLTTMEILGAKRHRICAVIGPTIHQPNYQVSYKFKMEFLHLDPDNIRFFYSLIQNGKILFDLPGLCYKILKSESVGFIDNLGQCTYSNDSLFYSHRRAQHTSEICCGRQLSAIIISP
ncbi:MAG: Polyphenol oxidase [Hyphomicrobiaceae bacterium hypho_1]